MTLERLDHVNIRTRNLQALVEFYEQVIGLESGQRPGLDSSGAWLYLGDRDIVHLIESPTAQSPGEPQIEHFALRATGYQEFVDNLNALGVRYRGNTIGEAGIRQLHLHDPDGNHVEVNFACEQ